MKTVIETPTFQKQAESICTEEERLAFISWISQNPLAGHVIPGADGARKVRWSIAGKGKQGVVRVIYFNLVEQDVIVLITLYQKSNQANIQASDIKKAV
jgi:mRNA-degrading endonuclease RelE of RelBE toxin-antitoxin system